MSYNYSESFGFALSQAAGVMKNRVHMALRGVEVTPEQTAVILRLSENRGVSPTVLAEAIAKDKPTTVRILAKLNQKGLISMQESLKDKRSYSVCLTEKGSALQARLIPIVEAVKAQALRDFEPAEIAEFNRLLKKTHRNLA
ncbi:MAG TPA: MarR family transcriptional regulator [Negativicutes bacterium]|nr:MarR family transcriptional regulator [Negativicutes bacterium]